MRGGEGGSRKGDEKMNRRGKKVTALAMRGHKGGWSSANCKGDVAPKKDVSSTGPHLFTEVFKLDKALENVL